MEEFVQVYWLIKSCIKDLINPSALIFDYYLLLCKVDPIEAEYFKAIISCQVSPLKGKVKPNSLQHVYQLLGEPSCNLTDQERRCIGSMLLDLKRSRNGFEFVKWPVARKDVKIEWGRLAVGSLAPCGETVCPSLPVGNVVRRGRLAQIHWFENQCIIFGCDGMISLPPRIRQQITTQLEISIGENVAILNCQIFGVNVYVFDCLWFNCDMRKCCVFDRVEKIKNLACLDNVFVGTTRDAITKFNEFDLIYFDDNFIFGYLRAPKQKLHL